MKFRMKPGRRLALQTVRAKFRRQWAPIPNEVSDKLLTVFGFWDHDFIVTKTEFHHKG